MRRMLKTISNTAGILFLLVISLSSCYQPIEGCLDSNASNFNVYADDNCCCTYPTITVQVVKQIDGAQIVSSALLADTLTNDLGQKYQVESLSFYISNLKLTYSDGTTSQVLDTLERPIPADATVDTVIEDNFGLVRTSTAAYTVGHIEQNGKITQVDFNVGLTDEINMLVPSQMPSSHALGSSNESDHFVEGSGYVYIRWSIKPIDVTGVEDINVVLSGSSALKAISLAADIDVAAGSTTTISLAVDYIKWLQGIDFAADLSTIEAKVLENTSSALSIL